MYDGSHHPYDENVAEAKEVAEFAHKHDVTVEAELGVLAGIEDDVVAEVMENLELIFKEISKVHNKGQADEYIEDFAEIYSDDTMLEYNQPFTDPGEFYWTCPDHVAEIILTMCSGYKSTPTDSNPNHIDRYSASFQFCGYNYIDFSTAPIPEPGNIEDLDVNKFYDRIANEYDSTLLNTVIGGSELLFATDHTEFAIVQLKLVL